MGSGGHLTVSPRPGRAPARARRAVRAAGERSASGPRAQEGLTAASNRPGVEGWEVVEEAERRLEERSGKRNAARDRRRRRARVLRWVVRVLLPVAGAAVFVGVLERSGGDLGGWSTAEAGGFLAAAFLVPAALAAWLARGAGPVQAAAWAVGTFGVQGALVFGVAFLALGLGPR